jgi:hypothetical protein
MMREMNASMQHAIGDELHSRMYYVRFRVGVDDEMAIDGGNRSDGPCSLHNSNAATRTSTSGTSSRRRRIQNLKLYVGFYGGPTCLAFSYYYYVSQLKIEDRTVTGTNIQRTD